MAIEQLAVWVKEQEISQFRVENDGTRDLVFQGVELDSTRQKTGTGRHLEITIWATTGGNLVVHKWHGTQWQGCQDRHETRVCHSIAEALKFLESHDGYLGQVSRSVWEEACRTCLPLAGQDVEQVL